MGFIRPQMLLLAIPWVGFWIWFAWRQKASCEWVWGRVDERFRRRFTLYRPGSLKRSMALLLVLGLLLVVAAAGPVKRGETEVRELASRVVVLLDGSASMLADDVSGGEDAETRFQRGRRIAADLAGSLEGSKFALVVFSGVSALQLPMTSDPTTIQESLGSASFHTFYRSSGSSFTAALDSALHFVEPGHADLQVVLLSDGEQPYDEPYDEPLAALEEAGVPVHTVAIGSREGQRRLIFDFRDVVAGKEEKTVLREYHTRREDRHLRRIARATGGRFTHADGGAADELTTAVEKRILGADTIPAEGWQDLSHVPLTLFLIGFLFEALISGRRRSAAAATFDIGALGGGRRGAAAGLVLLLTGGLLTLSCRDSSPLGRASRENERGIAADALESWPQARVHYDRSRAFGVQPEIPAYNLARSVTLQEDWSEAHDLYQGALELAPQLAVGHYNDGHVLYRWGEAELDLESCQLERTLELWSAARHRFAGAAELFGEEQEARRDQARANLRFLGERIRQVEEACAPPPPPQSGGAGQSEQRSGGQGEAEDESESESEGGQQSGGGREQGGESGEQEQDPEQGGEGGGDGDGEPQSGEEGEEPQGGGGAGDDEADTGDQGEQQEGSGDEDEQQGETGGEGDEQEGEGGDEGEQNGSSGEEGDQEGDSGEEGDQEGDSGEDGEQEGDSGQSEGEDEGDGGGDPGDGGGEAGDQESGGGPDGEQRPGGGGSEGDGEGGGGALPDLLSAEELEQVQQALARIAEGRFADGRYHYRSLPEQFPKEVWENPSAEIWW